MLEPLLSLAVVLQAAVIHPDVIKHTGLTGALNTHCAGISREQAVAVAVRRR